MAQAGNPRPPADQVRGQAFRDHALAMSFVTALAAPTALAALRRPGVAHDILATVRIAAANVHVAIDVGIAVDVKIAVDVLVLVLIAVNVQVAIDVRIRIDVCIGIDVRVGVDVRVAL